MAAYDQDRAQEILDALQNEMGERADLANATLEKRDRWLVEHPALAFVAAVGRLPLTDVILGSMAHSRRWGERFEDQCKRPATMHDWKDAYYIIQNDFAHSLGLQDIYVGDDHRMTLQYGGPF